MKFVRTATLAGILGIGAALASAPVHAQTLPIVGGPTSLQVGGFFPNSSDAKDRGGSTQLNADLRYHLPVPLQSATPSETFFDLGVQTGAKDGKHSTVIPLTVGELVGLSGQSPDAAGAAYAGAGVGVYFLNQSGLSTAARIGGFGELGYNINSRLFVDARYQFVDHADGPSANIGFRF